MSNGKPYSSLCLAVAGVIVMGMGPYFVVVRPPLLPEDARYLGTNLVQLQSSMPGLRVWLKWVFTVMGGYIFATGLLTAYLALTNFRSRAQGAAWVAALVGLSSVGLMAAVNFAIGSYFKWLLLGFALLWAAALGLYGQEGCRLLPARS